MANEIIIKVEITLTVTPALERALLELARAIAKPDQESSAEEMARITKAAGSSVKQ